MQQGNEIQQNKRILAFVGMPGGGKTEAIAYLEKKSVRFIRFGEFTDLGVKELGLPLTPENERMVRENLRKKLGMAAYAILAEPKIENLLQGTSLIAIDGLYSWEEYVLLKHSFLGLVLIHIYAEPIVRYQRLANRKIRPLTGEEARNRDIAEIEKLNKGGPIAIADYMIENNGEDIEELYKKIDELLIRLHISL